MTALILSAAFGALLAWIVREVLRAPEGHQDSTGFHYGPEPTARIPLRADPVPGAEPETGRTIAAHSVGDFSNLLHSSANSPGGEHDHA